MSAEIKSKGKLLNLTSENQHVKEFLIGLVTMQ